MLNCFHKNQMINKNVKIMNITGFYLYYFIIKHNVKFQPASLITHFQRVSTKSVEDKIIDISSQLKKKS